MARAQASPADLERCGERAMKHALLAALMIGATALPTAAAAQQSTINQTIAPNLIVDKPEPALDEARAKAIAIGRARAELYARSLGLRVVRVVSVNENGGEYAVPPPRPMMVAGARMEAADTKIEPGEQK